MARYCTYFRYENEELELDSCGGEYEETSIWMAIEQNTQMYLDDPERETVYSISGWIYIEVEI